MTKTKSTANRSASARDSGAVFRLKPLPRLMRQAFAMAALCTQIPGGALAAAPAPGVRIPVTALPSGPTTQSALPTTIGGRTIYSPQVVSGAFGSTPYSVVTNPDGTVTGTIKQADNAGILQWRTFDIGANATVNVEQPSSTAVLLNKVSDGDWNHSTLIEGKLNANGQVYIYNPNGIIFGKTSQVNVNTLVATSLKISDSRFLAGLLANGTAAFAADPNASYVDAYGNVVSVGLPGAITVEGDSANWASLTAANGGKILLVAPTIVNDGQLSAPNGQVLLAAGRKVYLSAPSGVRMRGLQAGVNNDAIGSTIAAGDSEVTNEGKITVGTGNATLIGKTVNQMGMVSATTSVNVNGSIYLIARDGARPADQGTTFTGNDFGGALVLGAGSVTEIQPTLDDSGTSGAAFNASLINVSGKSVHLKGDGAGHGALIQAPAGEVIINAIANTSGSTASKGSGNSITLDAGAVIDVSGTRSTRLAMENNVIQVELRGTELGDDPLLRNSPLRGKTVSVDVRKGNLKIANIQGWLDLVQHNVGQSTAVGGTVTLKAEDAVVLNQGSTVNVSGGMVSYLPGYVATSQLIWNGRLFDIATATADRIYTGVVDATPGPRNYEAGYVQGYSAGTISVDAPTASLGGTLVGTATAGPKQRDVSSRPLGGQLLVGSYDKDTGYGLFQDHFVLGSGGSSLALDPAALAASGFTRLGVYTDGGDITVNGAVQLAAGGSLTLRSAGNVDLAAGITVPGGTVSVAAKSIIAEPNLAVDVSGLWTNDRLLSASERDAQGNPINPVVTQGGSIALNGQTVTLGSGSRFDASGGAWLNTSGKLSAGVGGSISVTSSTTPNDGALTLGDGVAFSAYGINKGGTLTLSARNVTIGADDSDPLGIRLDPGFFQQGGFAKYDIRGADHLTVAAGTTVAPRMDNWISTRSTATTASGSMKDAFGITTLPLAGAMGLRGATDLSLSALAIGFENEGRLNLEAGARIVADPGATVSLNAGRQLTVDGEISAHGGTINLALTPTLADIAGTSTQYFADRSIWIGSGAVLDASGTTTRLWQDGTGLTQGNLLDGGAINIGHYEKDSATTLYAAPGYVVVEKGAQLDVSGTTATMTLALGSRGGRSTRTVASAGGSIDIRAREGLLLEGSLYGAGGNASAAGGSLSVVLDREWAPPRTADPAGYSSADRNLLVAATSSAFPAVAGPDLPLTGWEGQGFVSAKTINQGGFDWVRLKSQNTVSFDLGSGDLGLQARAGLTVDAPAIAAAPGAKANSSLILTAPYVQLGNSDWRYQSAVPSPSSSVAGGVGLSVDADTVDIIGQSALQGFDAATIDAKEDVRLVGQVPIDLSKSPATAKLPVIEATGSLSVAGSMTFTAAQLYPTTMSQFELTATGTGSRITFNRNSNSASASASAPFSAAASLKVTAQNIDQNGIVRAPLGKIVLDASDTLSYGADSLTSVKADGLIPLGFVQNGRDWLYDFGNGNAVNLSDTTANNHYALPDKSIVSGGKSVTFDKKAVLDLSGGGDLYAYEFTPGPGGSRDVLAPATGKDNKPLPITTFAILPGYASTVAPRDFQYGQDGGLKPGDSVYLSGIPGLLAGYYTLLPAHYALLPGAYSVTAASGSTDMAASGNVARLDGSWIVAGYRASLGGGADNRWSGFTVTASPVVRTYSGFGDYFVNSFHAVLPSLPKDGGHVVFDVGQFLALDGLVRLGGASGGSNGIADISAPDIAVVANASDSVPAGTLKLVAGDLVAMGADSLLIGGVRETTSAGDRVTVGAENVVVQNEAAHPLTGPEVILAATDTVVLKSNSVIQAKGTLSRTPRTLLLSNKSAPTAGADGALVRVSNGAAVALQRSYTDADGTILAPAGATGKLDIAANVTLSAGGSMMLDATQSTTIGSALTLADGTALGLGSSRISLGSGAPATVDGLRFDDTAITALSALSSLALTSYSTIDVYGTVNLGSSAMQSLTFAGAGMRGMGAVAPKATFTAQTIRFDQAGTDATAVTVADSSVAFNARDIEIGKGAFALHGFASANLNATNEIRAVGKGGALTADNDLTLAAGRITARSAADAAVTAGGKLKLTQGSGVAGTLPTLALGGILAFKGKTITSDANIVALAGQVSLTSTASADDIANGLDVTHGTIYVNGGTISAAGGSEAFGTTVAHAAAGSIALDGGNGNVNVESAATLDVSATGADAGALSVTATSGTATLNGTLKGGSDDATMTQGQFALDVGTVGTSGQFTALNDKLNAGGFIESRTVRARHGDIVVADAGSGVDAIKAHQVVLAADNGNVTVGGQINASGPKGGRIELYAAEATATGKSGNVTLLGAARLLANATTAATSSAGSTGDGGSIVIGTATADGTQPAGLPTYTTGDPAAKGDAGVFIVDGAVLDVRGSGVGQGGRVLLRAPRLSGNNDVALATTSNTTLANAVRGASDLAIEGYKTYSAVTRVDPLDGASKPMITAADVGSSGSYYDDANKFLSAANKSAMQNRLGAAANLRAGVEVDSAGDLTVEVNEAASNPQDRGWNLNTWRFGGQPGVLTLRAAGNLIVAGSISDGFTKPTTGKVGMPDWALDTSGNSSWSYRLVGGADQAAANPLATKSGAGDVKITFARTTGSATDLPVALVRTGAGFINIAAGRDAMLDTLDLTAGSLLGGDFSSVTTGDQLLGASVYTAGKATSLSSTITDYNNTDYGSPKKTSTGAAFTSNGGSISILAHGNVVGPVTNQMIDNWLFRQGRSYVDNSGATVFDTKSGVPQSTAWWSRFDYFNQGIATFGGGDITVIAETGNVRNVSASIATNAYFSGTSPTNGTLIEQGGGDLIVRAGGDIRGGSFYVQKGSAVLTAGASVTAGDHVVEDSDANTIPLAPVLAAGDAQFRVAARGNLAIEGIFNPTMTAQSVNNVTATAASQLDASSTATNTLANQFGSYLTYADNSAVSLTSLSGDLVLKGNTGAVSAAAGGNLLVADTSWYGLLPGTLHARALGGNLTVENGFSLAPSASGQFELLAKGSILFHNNTPVVMLDMDPLTLPTSTNPIYGPTVFGTASLLTAMQGNTVGTAYHTDGGLHAGNPDPVRIIALDGDIASTNLDTVLVLPKRAEISAGRDIRDLGFNIQQLAATDITTVSAGRDILDSTVVSSALNPVAHIVSGPGRVDFVAGRNFDLGDSKGVVTKGNLDNPYLPTGGAGITVMAGATADYAGFADSYAASLGDLSSAARTLLVADMKTWLKQLQPSMTDEALANLTPSDAWIAFNALPTAARNSVLNDLFYEKIAEVTGAKGGGTLDLAAFDGVIASLFPTASITGGDINVFGSQLKTDRGGAITLFAPGGSVYAGLTSVPAYLSDNRRASDLGIFTVGGGAIQSLVKTNFLVNLGRVFTLGGGDITLVSQYGDIDAGKGAKTSQATPPPIVTTDAKGNTEVDISGSISGSGIATLRTSADVPASDVYPIAPRGIFDAGDAGIRSTGSVNIVAQTVLNANNIAAAGSVSGTKTVDAGGLGGAVSTPTTPPTTKTEGFTAPGAGDPNAASLTVELLGYGNADGLEPVTKAGQTNGFADDDSEDERKKKKSQKPAANSR